uniref:Uncharacterized protein n=1 Tax=Vespula pensylvanica TaxID=30213 RepID=A0A834KA80_VESPE|nr:hypothetical protein H0235_015558 [Vespula pensylvanica]
MSCAVSRAVATFKFRSTFIKIFPKSRSEQSKESKNVNYTKSFYTSNLLIFDMINSEGQYVEIYEDLKQMGQVSATNKEVYYIPRHVVIKESSVTTKLRAVFDTSEKSNTEVSRNNILIIRPNIQDGFIQIIEATKKSYRDLSARKC